MRGEFSRISDALWSSLLLNFVFICMYKQANLMGLGMSMCYTLYGEHVLRWAILIIDLRKLVRRQANKGSTKCDSADKRPKTDRVSETSSVWTTSDPARETSTSIPARNRIRPSSIQTDIALQTPQESLLVD